jgi:hypothetical protein
LSISIGRIFLIIFPILAYLLGNIEELTWNASTASPEECSMTTVMIVANIHAKKDQIDLVQDELSKLFSVALLG